jgi:UDP-GlcNAc:undecaprenyl-phosphate GlcNAc-1-phosphate transferase
MAPLTHTDWLKISFCFSFGLLTSVALIPIILQRAVRCTGANRGRDFHHLHNLARVDRLGGIALAAAFIAVALAIFSFDALSPASANALGAIVIGSLAMFVLGFWDDLRRLGPRLKFIVQIGIAASTYYGGIKIEILKNPFTNIELALGHYAFFVTVAWLVTLTNLINLIDGIDGLAGGICLMLMCLLANLGMGVDSGFSLLLPIGVAGALVGFLKYNYPPAKIYMGDGGAYLLGFLIAALSIVNSNKGTVVAALVAPAFALALPIADVALAVLRRGWRGLPVFRPDQKHIHHGLIKLGFSRERTVLILYTVSMLCLLLAFGVFWLQDRLLPLFSGLLFLVFATAGHVSGFTRNWFSVGSQWNQSSALRRETRYALILGKWLEMEVERQHSFDQLWNDYQFLVKKLGFSRVTLASPESGCAWPSENSDQAMDEMRHARHELDDGSALEFCAEHRLLPEHLFVLLADLAAEIWNKAVSRWRLLNKTSGHSLLTPSRLALSPSEKTHSISYADC